MRTLLFSVSLLALTVSCASAPRGTAEDRAAVERAVLDYVVAIETDRPELIERSVHPDLTKIGYSWKGEEGYSERAMTYERLVEIADTMLELGYVPEDVTHEVELLEVYDKTASARLTAFWGIDFMHLVKQDGQWKIVHVLWQSPPEEALEAVAAE